MDDETKQVIAAFVLIGIMAIAGVSQGAYNTHMEHITDQKAIESGYVEEYNPESRRTLQVKND